MAYALVPLVYALFLMHLTKENNELMFISGNKAHGT